MGYIKDLINKVFKDVSSREVVDLTTVLTYMSDDYGRGVIDEEGVRAFLRKNKLYLKAVLDRFASPPINVDEFVEMCVEAVVLESLSRPGRGLSTSYVMGLLRPRAGRTAGTEGREEPI